MTWSVFAMIHSIVLIPEDFSLVLGLSFLSSHFSRPVSILYIFYKCLDLVLVLLYFTPSLLGSFSLAQEPLSLWSFHSFLWHYRNSRDLDFIFGCFSYLHYIVLLPTYLCLISYFSCKWKEVWFLQWINRDCHLEKDSRTLIWSFRRLVSDAHKRRNAARGFSRTEMKQQLI